MFTIDELQELINKVEKHAGKKQAFLHSANAHVFIDTAYTLDHGWETMVFECDSNNKVTDWHELDVDWYETSHDAAVGHCAKVVKWQSAMVTFPYNSAKELVDILYKMEEEEEEEDAE